MIDPCSFGDCDHQTGYLGWNEEWGDYDLCACHYGDGVAYECEERYGVDK